MTNIQKKLSSICKGFLKRYLFHHVYRKDYFLFSGRQAFSLWDAFTATSCHLASFGVLYCLFAHSRSFPNGDIISWDREPWALRSPWNRSEPELLDLENDICSNKENGYFMVPHKLSFDESIHVCKKLSGTPVTFTNKTIFDDIVHHLSLASNMRASGCAQTLEDGSRSVQVWGGGSDEAREGVWTTWDTNQKIEVGAGEFSILSVYAVLFLNSIYYGVKIDLTMIQKEHLIVW